MRIVAIFNKWWECDPALAALLNQNGRPAGLPWPILLGGVRERPNPAALPPENPVPLPRAVFQGKSWYGELWCISDLLEHLEDKTALQSSTERKARYMHKIFRGDPPDLVIAAGTAGFPDSVSQNGNVVVGTNCFVHDPNQGMPNPDSAWSSSLFDSLVSSILPHSSFETLLTIPKAPARFLIPPLKPAEDTAVLAGYGFVALSGVNVTDPAKYAQSDGDTLAAFDRAKTGCPAKSLETTHGLIRLQSTAPFLFISGITDRVGHFDTDVQARPFAQNTAPS
jgi:hypothetical protein